MKLLNKITALPRTELRRKARRWLGYLLIGIVIVASSIATVNMLRVAWLKTEIATLRAEADSAEKQLENVEAANDNMEQTLQTLQNLRAVDSEALRVLSERLVELGEQDARTRTQLEALEKSNEQARHYLDTVVDPAVRRLLDQPLPPRRRTGARADAAAAAAEAVRAAERAAQRAEPPADQ